MDFGMLAEKWIDDHGEIIVMEAEEIARKAFLAGVEAAQQSFIHDVSNESAKVVKCMHGYIPQRCSICSARV